MRGACWRSFLPCWNPSFLHGRRQLFGERHNTFVQDAPSQRVAEYEHELAVCEQQVADLLLHVGRNGRPIDYKKLPDQGLGYRLRPWEDDAFACDFVVGQQWFGRALPEPDRCNQFYDLKDGERPDARL
ncbi:hypothetical protein [Cupriavidus basilensis]|uniref:hypothetical protein n=1 Tax=Cupriavidus basilensis TaxID=68895 RepID=UPI0020A63490|nr:hypothetical protein [Cupriavidus basilensis]MCP3025307.1 hypothetical protein [Cupriavidus basilensis]